MYHTLLLEADALDAINGTFYYNDKSSVFLTTNIFEATALTDNELVEVRDGIIRNVKLLLDLFTNGNGMFDKSAKLVAVSPEFKIPLIIISTTISKLIRTGIKEEKEPCKSSYILEISELNDYWLKDIEKIDIFSMARDLIFRCDSSIVI